MPDPFLRVLALSLAGLFVWSAAAKVLRWDTWRTLLGRFGLPRAWGRPAAVLVPLCEVMVAAALLMGAVRLGAAASLALLAAFSLAILGARSRGEGDKLPCGCFGKTTTRDYRISLARNALLALMASALLVRGEDVSPLGGFGAPSGSEVVPLLLILLGGVVIGWMVRSVVRVSRNGS